MKYLPTFKVHGDCGVSLAEAGWGFRISKEWVSACFSQPVSENTAIVAQILDQ